MLSFGLWILRRLASDVTYFKKSLKSSVTEAAPQRAGALTGCGSSSEQSKRNVPYKWIIKGFSKCISFLLFPIIFVTSLIIQKSEEKIAQH
jgi:hypothetical protein